MLIKTPIGNVRFSFTFLALVLLCIVNRNNELIFASVVSSLMHEWIHIAFLLAFGCRIERVDISMFGGNIARDSSEKVSPLKESIINLSAPLFNSVLGLFILLFKRDSVWGYVNIFLGIFNLLPFYNFDGGNGLSNILILFLEKRTVDIIIDVLSFFVIGIITLFNIYTSFSQNNSISVIFINIYFILCFVYRIFRKSSCFV